MFEQFDQEFYPTPKKVIEKMLEPWRGKSWKGGINGYESNGFSKLNGKTILEPSAGSGMIVDYITGNLVVNTRVIHQNAFNEMSNEDVKKSKIYCCEKDPNLKYILQGKGYRVIADDFLEYNGDYYFDLILMNPPFSNGDEHLLKAWSILDSGDIVCLLNSETINNPYSAKRKHLKNLIESFGSVEELGNVFSDADRKTDVNVSLVRLRKEKRNSKFDFEFEEVNKEKRFSFDESVIYDAPAFKDIIGNMLLQYEKIKETFVDYMRVSEQMNHYGKPLISSHDGKVEHPIDIFAVAQNAFQESSNKREAHNVFCGVIKHHMWKIVMKNMNNISSFDMEKFMTDSVRKNFSKFSSKQGDMDFTRENVWNLITMLFENKHNILEKAIEEVFDIFTSYYKENRLYVEGWKTNSKWKVNRKVILPNAVKWGIWSSASDLKKWGGSFDLSYDTLSKYSDIDKALDYISGRRKDNEGGLHQSLTTRFKEIGKVFPGDQFKNTGESFYFNWKFFKKGTLHIEFKDKKLWEQFNLRACANRNWLPEDEQKAYEEQRRSENAKVYQEGKKMQMKELTSPKDLFVESEFQL